MWSVVAAASYPERVIGRGGKLPWHLPLELRLFRSLTWGGILVMGRRTWESIGKPLPGREIWVLTRQSLSHPEVKVFSAKENLLEALRRAQRPIFFVGGAQVYAWALTLPEVERLYITWVYLAVEGDAFLPQLDERTWHPRRWEFFYEGCVPMVQVEYERAG